MRPLCPGVRSRAQWRAHRAVVGVTCLLLLVAGGCASQGGGRVAVTPSAATLTVAQKRDLTDLSARYFRLVRQRKSSQALRLFFPQTRRTAKDVIVRDASRIQANPDAGRIVESVPVSLERGGRLVPPVGFVTIYASDAERLQTLAADFDASAIICLRMSDGSSVKMFAVGSGGRYWLLP